VKADGESETLQLSGIPHSNYFCYPWLTELPEPPEPVRCSPAKFSLPALTPKLPYAASRFHIRVERDGMVGCGVSDATHTVDSLEDNAFQRRNYPGTINMKVIATHHKPISNKIIVEATKRKRPDWV
jgi:hypothetical protein